MYICGEELSVAPWHTPKCKNTIVLYFWRESMLFSWPFLERLWTQARKLHTSTVARLKTVRFLNWHFHKCLHLLAGRYVHRMISQRSLITSKNDILQLIYVPYNPHRFWSWRSLQVTPKVNKPVRVQPDCKSSISSCQSNTVTLLLLSHHH